MATKAGPLAAKDIRYDTLEEGVEFFECLKDVQMVLFLSFVFNEIFSLRPKEKS